MNSKKIALGLFVATILLTIISLVLYFFIGVKLALFIIPIIFALNGLGGMVSGYQYYIHFRYSTAKQPVQGKMAKISGFVTLLGAILGFLFIFNHFYINEFTANDSIPLLLTNKVTMKILKKYPTTFSLTSLACGSDENINNYINRFFNKSNIKNQAFCHKYSWGDTAVLYFINPDLLSEGQRILILKDDMLYDVINITGSYPGNRITGFQFNGEKAVFKFSGWRNPEKIIELRLN